jgi:hypothetical protein
MDEKRCAEEEKDDLGVVDGRILEKKNSSVMNKVEICRQSFDDFS